MAKTNLPFNLTGEKIEYQRLYELSGSAGRNMTTSGSYSFTSLSSSTVYSTTTGGEYAVFQQLQTALVNYDIADSDFNNKVDKTDISAYLKFADIINDFIVSGSLPATSATLTTTIPNQIAYVLGQRVDKASEDHTFTASKDIYIDLSNTASYTYVEVANAAAAPAITANSIRLFKIVTDASAITTVTDLRTLNPKINKNVEIAADPTTALGITTKQYVDPIPSETISIPYTNIPIGSRFTTSDKFGFITNVAAGDTTIYTTPSGKIASLEQYPLQLFNPTAAAITVNYYLVPSGGAIGTTTQINTVSLSAGAQIQSIFWVGVLKPGDSLVINTSAVGVNVWWRLYENSTTNLGHLDYGYVGNLGTAVTTVYTVPATKRARVLVNPMFFNPTAAAITVTMYAVPSGGTAGSGNEYNAISVGAGAMTYFGPMIDLNSGDSIQMVGSAAGVNVWFPVMLF